MKHLSDIEMFLYIDRALQEEESRNVERHLALCGRCQRELRLLSDIEEKTRLAEGIRVEEESSKRIVESVLERVDQEFSERPIKPKSSRIERVGFAILGTLLLSSLVFILIDTESSGDNSTWFDNITAQTQPILDALFHWNIWPSLLLLGGAFVILYIIDHFITKSSKPRS